MWGGFVTSTWTMSVDVSLSTCTSTAEDAKGKTMWPSMSKWSLSTCEMHRSMLLEPFETFLLVAFSCLVIFFCVCIIFFLNPTSSLNVRQAHCPLQSNAVAALKQSHSKKKRKNEKGRHWQRRGMGPIILLTTDFIPRVKGLLSITFTWFKSLAQLNQKSMKSFGYIFGLSCQHFKLGTIVSFLWFVLGHQLSKKSAPRDNYGRALAWLKSDNSLKNITHSFYGSA